MKNIIIIFLFAWFATGVSCNNTTEGLSKPFFDPYGKKVGDSVFYDNLIQKIVFTDSTYEIDSVVFSRYDNQAKSLKSVNTFMDGKHVFENVDYYSNGKIARYKFIDEEKSNYFYERWYRRNGAFLESRGYVFFQGYIIDTTLIQDEKSRTGTSTLYRIFYPNPPDCIASMYVLDEDTGEKWSVFGKSRFLNFLQETWRDNRDTGFFKGTMLLELYDKIADTTIKHSQRVIFEVVSNETMKK
jgi:hypothetical protein